MATAAATFPQQQGLSEPEAASSSSITAPEALSSGPSRWQSSGSIGPFFAVISILAILAFISCAVGRAYSRRAKDPNVAPLDSIERRSLIGWLKEWSYKIANAGAEFGTRLKLASFWRKGGDEDGKNRDLPQV